MHGPPPPPDGGRREGGALGALARAAGALLLPVGLALFLAMLCFLLGPILWWWLSLRNEWSVQPDRWTIAFWLTMFFIWCGICFFTVLFLHRCKTAFSTWEDQERGKMATSTVPIEGLAQLKSGELTSRLPVDFGLRVESGIDRNCDDARKVLMEGLEKVPVVTLYFPPASPQQEH